MTADESLKNSNNRHFVATIFIGDNRVELEGFEPSSGQVAHRLSTCLAQA